MSWTAPAAQIWHVEAFLLLCLVVKLSLWSDGRKYFEALMACALIFDVAGLIFARIGDFKLYTNLTYASYLVETPLMALALSEAADFRPTHHRRILFWWMAATVACLGIRYFPYSGRALLICNIIAYTCWLVSKRV